MIMGRKGIATHFKELIEAPAAKLRQGANYALARKPRFVIIGTGRSGTTFTARHLSQAGIIVSHEQYFTFRGPLLRNPNRDWRTEGDSSWCAVPYLPDTNILAIHQVRHPLEVIKSFYNIGFFDSKHVEGRRGFVEFAKSHFEFSDDPLRSCLRWYIEWNQKCEAITDRRFRVENFFDCTKEIENWLEIDTDLSRIKTSSQTNTRKPRVVEPLVELRDALQELPEFPQLQEISRRYGYEV